MSSKAAPSPDPRALGINKSRLSTNEQARPIPWFCGKRSIGVTFISKQFDTYRQQNQEQVAKESTVTGTKYWTSFLALIGYGVLTRVTEIRLNDDVAWSGEVFFNGADMITIQLPRHGGLPNAGKVYIYAGTETQPVDPYVKAWMLTKGRPLHPAYRGFAYAVFRQLYTGLNQTDVQTVEITCDRIPQISWTAAEQIFTGGTNDPRRCNVIAALADLLQNQRCGLGLADDLLNTIALDAVATQLKTEKVGIAPFYDRAQEMRSIASDLLAYADAYPLAGADGRLSVGLVRKPADVDALPVVDQSHFARRPDIPIGDWSAIATQTEVKYTDPDEDINNPQHGVETSAKWRDRGAYRITGEPNLVTADRVFSLDGQLYATAMGRANAMPTLSGNLTLRRTGTLFDDLAPGAQFRLNYPARKLDNLVCRVLQRTEARAGARQFEIQWTVDRSYLTPNSSAAPVKADAAKSLEETVEVSPVVSARMIELPLALCPDGQLSLAVLAARPSEDTSALAIHLRKNYDFDGDPAASYTLLATTSQFAQTGLLEEDYDAATIDDSLGLLVRLTFPDTTLGELTPFDGTSDTLLVCISDEILSVHRVELVDTDTYRLYCLRGRFATTAVAHSAGTAVHIMARESLLPLQHPQLDLGNEWAFKLAPVEGAVMLDLGDAPEITGVVAGRIYKDPPLANLSANGQVANAVYRAGEDIDVMWTITDAHADFWQDQRRDVSVILELLDAADAIVHTFTLDGLVDSQAIANADLVGWLGAETNFSLRLTRRTALDAGIVDSDPITLAVTKL